MPQYMKCISCRLFFSMTRHDKSIFCSSCKGPLTAITKEDVTCEEHDVRYDLLLTEDVFDDITPNQAFFSIHISSILWNLPNLESSLHHSYIRRFEALRSQSADPGNSMDFLIEQYRDRVLRFLNFQGEERKPTIGLLHCYCARMDQRKFCYPQKERHIWNVVQSAYWFYLREHHAGFYTETGISRWEDPTDYRNADNLKRFFHLNVHDPSCLRLFRGEAYKTAGLGSPRNFSEQSLMLRNNMPAAKRHAALLKWLLQFERPNGARLRFLIVIPQGDAFATMALSLSKNWKEGIFFDPELGEFMGKGMVGVELVNLITCDSFFQFHSCELLCLLPFFQA